MIEKLSILLIVLIILRLDQKRTNASSTEIRTSLDSDCNFYYTHYQYSYDKFIFKLKIKF